MLLSNEVASIEGLAKHLGLDRDHVGQTPNLAFLKGEISPISGAL
jgi:hypothetical protein